MTDPALWLNFDEIRLAAQRRLPKGLFAVLDNGAEESVAMANNRDALRRIKLRTTVLRDVSGRSTRCSLFGKPMDMPVIVAPTGPVAHMWYRGGVDMARAAAKAGIPCTTSAACGNPLEEVRSEGGGRQWFQIYVGPERREADEVVDRAQAAGFEGLVVTVDSVVAYNNPRGARSGFSMPFRLHPGNVWDIVTHPRWMSGVVLRYLSTTGLPNFPNYPGYAATRKMLKNDTLNWADLEAFRRRWKGPLIVKGINQPRDALQCIECGADGIVVSNHGGYTFDNAVAPIDVLPEIAQAVKGRAAVIVDSGFRRGSEVAKALCLGADAVMVGRLPLMALAAAGEAGVARGLALMKAELLHTMAVMGCNTLDELGPQHVWQRP